MERSNVSFNPLTASPTERAVRYSWALEEPKHDPNEPPYKPIPKVRDWGVRAELTDAKQANVMAYLSAGAYNRCEIARLCDVTSEQVRTVEGRIRRGVAHLPVRRTHRLTIEEIYEIRDIYDPHKGPSQRELAARYGVARKTISAALKIEC